MAVGPKQSGLVGFVLHLRLFKETEHALGGGRAALQVLEGLRKLRKRLSEQADIHHERHDHAELDLPVERERRAHHAHHHVAEVAHEIHERHHQAGEELRLPAGLVEVRVVLLEATNRIGLAVVCLDDEVTGVHLLHVAVDVTQRHLLPGEVLLGGLHDGHHDDQADEAGTDGAQGHDHVVVEHHHQRAHEQRHRGNQRAERLAQRLADGVHIVGYARQHVAVANLVEVFERQFVDFDRDGLAQSLGGALGDVGHHPALHVAEHGVAHVQGHQSPGDVAHRAEIYRVHHRSAVNDGGQTFDDLVGHVLELVRADDLADGAGRAQDERDDDDGKIVAAIVHELAHDFAEIMGLFDGTPAAHWSSWHLFYSLKVRIDLPLMKEVARSAGGREAVRDYPSVSCAVLFARLSARLRLGTAHWAVPFTAQPLTWGATAAAPPYAVSSDWLSWDSAIWRYTSQLSSSSLCVP